MRDLVQLAEFSVTYLRSAANCYIGDVSDQVRKARKKAKPKEVDPSTKMSNWSLGRRLQVERRKKAPMKDVPLEPFTRERDVQEEDEPVPMLIISDSESE